MRIRLSKSVLYFNNNTLSTIYRQTDRLYTDKRCYVNHVKNTTNLRTWKHIRKHHSGLAEENKLYRVPIVNRQEID